MEGFFKTEGKLPLNVKFLIEGEEVGGEHIDEYVAAHPDRLKCDAALVCDTELFAPELPTITTGFRRPRLHRVGGARAAAHDLHSGMYGGAAPNPMQALAEMVNKLKGPDGKILIPGFYKRVNRRRSWQAGRSCPSTKAASEVMPVLGRDFNKDPHNRWPWPLKNESPSDHNIFPAPGTIPVELAKLMD